uniref:OTU domain-containing protein n=1 Tax=Cacopsylla melanoneura TaxID=428564 RepID=A0A8D8ZAZ5_9HEMI
MEHNFVIDGTSRSFRVIECSGDGACLFHSLSMALFGTEAHSYAIRSDIVRHIVSNFEHYSPSVQIPPRAVPPSDGQDTLQALDLTSGTRQDSTRPQVLDLTLKSPTADEYYRYMSGPYVMGDYLELTAAAALFQVRVIAIRQAHVECNVGREEWAPIVLEFSGDRGRGHFNLFWPSGVPFHKRPLPYHSPPPRPSLMRLSEVFDCPMEETAYYNANTRTVQKVRTLHVSSGTRTGQQAQLTSSGTRPVVQQPASSGTSTIQQPVSSGTRTVQQVPHCSDSNQCKVDDVNQCKTVVRKRGRPKKKKVGRPKTSEKTRAEQLRDAKKAYQKKKPEVNRKAVAKYRAANPQVNRKAVAKYAASQASQPEIEKKKEGNYFFKKRLLYRWVIPQEMGHA